MQGNYGYGPGLTASFQYDAFGRRKQKTVNGTTTNFLYDGLNVVQELNGATPTANLLTSLGIDETLLCTDSAGARAFLTDGLGSTLALTDSAGLMQSEYTYEPFGKTTATGTASTNAFTYTGREDDGTGLYYYRARYYHPALQRFVSEDPLGFRGGDVNLYGYVGNSPISFIDPLGLLGVGDVVGMIWNAPNTAIGVAWGMIGVPFGAQVNIGNNAIQFTNHPFMPSGKAVTLGNTIHYPSDFPPGTPMPNGYPVCEHEKQHTYQGQQLGPFYLPSNLLGGVSGLLNDANWGGPSNWNEVGPYSSPPRPWP